MSSNSRDWWPFCLTGQLLSYHCLMHGVYKVLGVGVRQGSLLFYRVTVVYCVQVQISYFREPTVAQWCVNIYEREEKKQWKHFLLLRLSLVYLTVDSWHEQILLVSYFPSWPMVDLNKPKVSSASLQNQKKTEKNRVSYSYSAEVVPGAAVRSWAERGHRWWWLSVNNPNLVHPSFLPRPRLGERPQQQWRKVGLPQQEGGSVNRGIRAETKPGGASQPWCLTRHRESVASATGRAVTRGMLGVEMLHSPSSLEQPHSITPVWDLQSSLRWAQEQGLKAQESTCHSQVCSLACIWPEPVK